MFVHQIPLVQLTISNKKSDVAVPGFEPELPDSKSGELTTTLYRRTMLARWSPSFLACTQAILVSLYWWQYGGKHTQRRIGDLAMLFANLTVLQCRNLQCWQP